MKKQKKYKNSLGFFVGSAYYNRRNFKGGKQDRISDVMLKCEFVGGTLNDYLASGTDS